MYGNIYPFIQKGDFSLEIVSSNVFSQTGFITPASDAKHSPSTTDVALLNSKELTTLGIGRMFEEGGLALNREGIGVDVSYNIVELDSGSDSKKGMYFAVSIPIKVKGSADATITTKVYINNTFISDDNKDTGVDKKTLIEICSKQRIASYSNQTLKVNGEEYDVVFTKTPDSVVKYKTYVSDKYTDGEMVLDANTTSIDLSFLITEINNNSTIEDSFFYIDKIDVTIEASPKNSSGDKVTKTITINLQRPILFTSTKNYELVFQREAGALIKKAPLLTKTSFNLIAVPTTVDAYNPEYVINSYYLYALLGYNSFMALGKENIFLAESDGNNQYKIKFYKHKNYFPMEHTVKGDYHYYDEDSKQIKQDNVSNKFSFSFQNGILVSQCEPSAKNENFITIIESKDANINGFVYLAKPHINSQFPILSSKAIYSTKYSYKLSEIGNPFNATQAAQFFAGLCNGSAIDEANLALMEISAFSPFAYITRNPFLIFSLIMIHTVFVLYKIGLVNIVNESIKDEGKIESFTTNRENTLLLSVFAKDLHPESVDALSVIHREAFLKSRMHSVKSIDFSILFFPFRAKTVNVASLEHPHMPTLEVKSPADLFDKDKSIVLTDDLKGYLLGGLQRLYSSNIFLYPFPLTSISLAMPASIMKLPVVGLSKNGKLFHPFINIETNKILDRIDVQYLTNKDKLLQQLDSIRDEVLNSKNDYLKYAFNVLYNFVNNSSRSGTVFSGKAYYGINYANHLVQKVYRANAGSWDAGAILIDKSEQEDGTVQTTRSFFGLKATIPTEDVLDKSTHLNKISLDVTLIDDKNYKETLTEKEYLNSTINISRIT